MFEKIKSKWIRFFRRTSTIRNRLLVVYMSTTVIILLSQVLFFVQVNKSVDEIDQVYATNVSANKLAGQLDLIQNAVYNYLVTKDSETLQNYYRYVSEYQDMISEMNDKVVENEYLMCEKSIHDLSTEYLRRTDKTILAKRGKNVELYKSYFSEATQVSLYIEDCINNLNNERLNENSKRYQRLYKDLQRTETISLIGIVAVGIVCFIFIQIVTRSIVRPLTKLAKSAHEVSEGNFDVEMVKSKNKDEIDVVIQAFNTMMTSIRIHMHHIQESNRKEREMKEKELRMEVHLKDARLKYLRAQINPHFLYNSLNTCVQLAIMENAEQTEEFVERMAVFFRYNVRRTVEDDNPFRDELNAVEAYIYIQNIRFGGDVTFTEKIDEGVDKIMVPTMILQPIVENAYNHGLRELDRPGKIELRVLKHDEEIIIQVEDNGHGMTKEKIEQVLTMHKKEKNIMAEEGQRQDPDIEQTGIGMDNVISRLDLYYQQKGLLTIQSDGVEKGTTVQIRIPVVKKGELDVSNITSG